MAFLKRFAFWKREAEEPVELSSPLPETDKTFPRLSSPGEQLEPSFAQHPFPPASFQQSSGTADAEMRVISAKLDTIKAMLDVMNQRLEKLEGRKSDDLVKWR